MAGARPSEIRVSVMVSVSQPIAGMEEHRKAMSLRKNGAERVGVGGGVGSCGRTKACEMAARMMKEVKKMLEACCRHGETCRRVTQRGKGELLLQLLLPSPLVAAGMTEVLTNVLTSLVAEERGSPMPWD